MAAAARLMPGPLLALLAAAVPAGQAAPPPDRFPRAASAYIVAIDGEVRWQRAPDVQRPPASLTKILTAFVVVERDWDPQKVITVSPRAAALQGTRLRLKAGEQLRAGDALTALLVGSANDACLALAEDAAGTVEAFVGRLGRRAAEIGLSGTHYENPCGLPEAGHVTTARDLLHMAELAMAMPEIARRVAMPEATLATLRGRRIRVRSTNMLLGRVSGVAGVKTGYTSQAGKCLVAFAERSDTRVTVVLLDAQDRWWTAAALIEEAFHVAAVER
jgi:D-alanyl-D-alanine carboxypeptidase (penicillin-binding protein 5/6)